MTERAVISYDSAGIVRYDVDPDGTLHITLAARGLGHFGIKSRAAGTLWVVFLVCGAMTPLAILAVRWQLGIHSELTFLLIAAAVIAPLTIAVGIWATMHMASERLWIDANAAGLRIRRQVFKSVTQQQYPRERIRGIQVIKDPEDSHWIIRVHGRYESEILLMNWPEADMRRIAVRLREALGVPERPAAG
jgi:hypothetical protein